MRILSLRAIPCLRHAMHSQDAHDSLLSLNSRENERLPDMEEKEKTTLPSIRKSIILTIYQYKSNKRRNKLIKQVGGYERCQN